MFAKLLVKGNILNLSPLVLDETFHGIREEYNALRKTMNQPAKPHSFFYDELKRVVDYTLNFSGVKIRQFEKSLEDGCRVAVDNIKKFSLAPKDAFSVAYMIDWGIQYIVSNDSNFDTLKSVSIFRLSY